MVAARWRTLPLVGTISVAFGCPFEGNVDPASFFRTSSRSLVWGGLRGARRHHGMATPRSVKDMFSV
jgi:hydroxymethylglutaryl-CoA lyase